MATKFSKKKFNKKKLANSLDKITSNVAKRKGYFFRKNKFNFYDIHDHTTKQKIIVDIPFQRTASAVTKKLNSKDPDNSVGLDRLQTKVQEFHKHFNDTVFYNYTLETSKDNFKKQVVISRLDLSISYLKMIKEDLINY